MFLFEDLSADNVIDVAMISKHIIKVIGMHYPRTTKYYAFVCAALNARVYVIVDIMSVAA